MELVIAEKPSVARDIARVLGATGRGEGCLKGEGYVVTWCVGHLVELEEPGSYQETWKKWRLESLPMVPDAFRLRPSKGSEAQWRVVRDLLRSRQFAGVINACDAGREGELIFRYCYELAGSRLPTRRLWISSMTDTALRAGFGSLRPGAQYDALADAARCRAEADWLVGMNATRAVTTRSRPGAGGALLSIGRVQTPTLALVVERERAIRAFVPRDYWEVTARLTAPEGSFNALWGFHTQRRVASAALAKELIERVSAHVGTPHGPRVERLERKAERQPPPLLFDLTSLQRTANKRYGLSAQRTLDIAQALYETHKLITYPRTDSRHLSGDLRNELPAVFRALGAHADYAPFATALLGRAVGPTPRVFQDSRVTDHHAIIPTSKAPTRALDRDEQHVHDLIVRRFLGAFYPDAEFALTTLVVLVGPDAPLPPAPDPVPARDVPLAALPPGPDRFHARGKILMKPGWREVAGLDSDDDTRTGPGNGAEDDEPSQRLPPVVERQPLAGSYAPLAKKTRPPPRYSEAALLSAMEFAGREIDDEALRLALKERGLGTPATRASMIETLLRRGYLERQQKNVVPTALGESLIDVLPVRSLASAELTGEWEARLIRMSRGDERRDVFMRAIVDYVREVVDQVRQSSPATLAGGKALAGPTVGPCPRCQGPVVEGFKTFGCQQCPFTLWKSVAGKTLSPKLAGLLLRTRRSSVLSGFRSKAGKPFQAALELDATGKIRLVFDSGPAANGAPSAGRAAPDEPDDSPASSGPAAAPLSWRGSPEAPDTWGRPAAAAAGRAKRAGGRAPGERASAARKGEAGGRAGGVLSAAAVASLSLASEDEEERREQAPPDPPFASLRRGASPDSGAMRAESAGRTADGERRTADGERRTADGGRRTADGERRTADGGRRTADGGQRTAEANVAGGGDARSEPRLAQRFDSAPLLSEAKGGSGGAGPRPPSARPTPAPPAPAQPTAAPAPLLPADEVAAMVCPRCGQGHLMTGRRAWGCSRWREGCTLVVPFAVGSKALTTAHLRELVTKGRTARKARWELGGQAAQGRLRLDLTAEPPALVVDTG